ncbi:MAG: GMC family oxidoreductase [Pseudoclavibacter sp.]
MPIAHEITESTPTSFDHIIIGAGSAGCAAARRLLDAGRTVAVVEAGGPIVDPRITDMRRVWELWGLETDWAFTSQPLAHANGTVVDLPRGKTFGGSSAYYGLVFARGAASDFDGWAADGATGWAWSDVLPVYQRLETYEGGADDHRGDAGPMPVNLNHDPNRLTHTFIEAANQAGIPTNPDYNGASQEGVAVAQINGVGTTRVTSWDAYLEPVVDDPNLTVFPFTLALRLVVDGDHCVGVEVESTADGSTRMLEATEDVVVAAGAYQSPQLLMVSGIGDRAELEAAGIETVRDLPGVGKNLQDHFLVPLVYEATNALEPQKANGTECHFFAKTDESLAAPDLQPILVARGMPVRGADVPEQAFTFLAGVVRPYSRGTVSLASSDTHDAPVIDLNYFDDPRDLQTMRDAIDVCRNIGAQPALAEERGSELFPGEDVTGDALDEYVRNQVLTYHHPSGTCRMGTDADAVVDPELRVHGIEGLRVADCSVFPSITSGNTHAPAVLVGERVADFILREGANA